MEKLDIEILSIGETKITIEPHCYAIKLTRRNQKTPVAIIQFKHIETRLSPSNPDIYYSTTSHNEIHQIKKYYHSIKEFKTKHPNMPFFQNNCWKDKVEKLLE